MTTQLNDKLIAVEVPQDANKECIINNKLIVYRGDLPIYDTYDLPAGNYSILGLCTPKEIGFDCEPYLERDYDVHPDVKTKWYYTTNKELSTVNKDRAFRSLLQSKGLDSGHYLIIEKC